MTDTRYSKDSLEQTDPRYRTLFENTGTATILIEEDMTISMANLETARISGIPVDRIIHRMKFPELIADADKEKVIRNHRLRRKNPDLAPRNYPCRVKVARDKILDCILTVAMIDGTSQSIASITDISRQKYLQREITNISEQERFQMGQVLHDDLGSHLAGVEAMAVLLSSRLKNQDHPETGLAQDISRLINQAMAKTRAMVRGLVPVDFKNTGLMTALDRYCKEIEKAFNLKCRIKTEDKEIELACFGPLNHLYYIIRESIHNAAKHSKARQIDIRFQDESDAITVEIMDDGSGMSENKNAGLGLEIMNHRAELINARLTLTQNTKGGTTVRCRIPKPYSS